LKTEITDLCCQTFRRKRLLRLLWNSFEIVIYSPNSKPTPVCRTNAIRDILRQPCLLWNDL
jgi:hypothetical protein